MLTDFYFVPLLKINVGFFASGLETSPAADENGFSGDFQYGDFDRLDLVHTRNSLLDFGLDGALWNIKNINIFFHKHRGLLGDARGFQDEIILLYNLVFHKLLPAGGTGRHFSLQKFNAFFRIHHDQVFII